MIEGAESEPGLVSGGVWLDLDGDGTRDAGEPPTGGVVVEPYRYGQWSAGMTTGADGRYEFAGLSPGDGYQVRFTLPLGARFSPAGVGPDDRDSDPDPLTGWTDPFAVASGGGWADIDAGLIPILVP